MVTLLVIVGGSTVMILKMMVTAMIRRFMLQPMASIQSGTPRQVPPITSHWGAAQANHP
jgi:hypothetical protein